MNQWYSHRDTGSCYFLFWIVYDVSFKIKLLNLTKVKNSLALVDINTNFIFHSKAFWAVTFETTVGVATFSRRRTIVQVGRTLVNIWKSDFSKFSLFSNKFLEWLTDTLCSGLVNLITLITNTSISRHVVNALSVFTCVWYYRTVVDHITIFVITDTSWAKISEGWRAFVRAGAALNSLTRVSLLTEYSSRITSRVYKQENKISKLWKQFLTDPGIFEAIRRPIRLRDRYSNTHHSELLLKKMSPPFVSTCPSV